MQASEKEKYNQHHHRRKLLPLPIKVCLSCGYESCSERDCGARKQQCRFYKKKVHLLTVCSKLQKKTGNSFPDLKDARSTREVKFIGFSIEEEVSITTLIKDQVAVDTLAFCIILNDKRHLLT